jgi:Antibiotic biosynthesis monooxygenase
MHRYIELFQVPVVRDEAFVEAWRRERSGALYRALRPDVDFRYAELGGAAASPLGYPSHAALYEPVHEDGRPDGTEGVTLINAFEVEAGEDEAFIAAWRAVRDILAPQRGYLGTRLHRSDQADFRYVNVARWSSPLMFSRAIAHAAGTPVPFRAHPALYLAL